MELCERDHVDQRGYDAFWFTVSVRELSEDNASGEGGVPELRPSSEQAAGT